MKKLALIEKIFIIDCMLSIALCLINIFINKIGFQIWGSVVTLSRLWTIVFVVILFCVCFRRWMQFLKFVGKKRPAIASVIRIFSIILTAGFTYFIMMFFLISIVFLPTYETVTIDGKVYVRRNDGFMDPHYCYFEYHSTFLMAKDQTYNLDKQ